MEERIRFTRGTKVEVLNMKDPPFGSWRCAEIVSGDGHTYMVRYYSPNSATLKNTLGRVSQKFIRPYQPLLDISRTWLPGEVVEVFNNFSWKMGKVSRVLGRNYFLVWLLGLSQVLRASSSNIRARRSWQDGQWTLIGPGSRTWVGTTVSRRREGIDMETYNFSGARISRYVTYKTYNAPPTPPESNDDNCSIQSSTSSCSVISGTGFSDPPSLDILSTHSSDAESSCYGNSRLGSKEVDSEVRRMELHAYRCTMEALCASRPLTWERESLVTSLRMSLHISNDERHSKKR